MTVALLNSVRFLASTSGLADFGDGTAYTGFRNLAAASAVNGAIYSYRAESLDRSEWEQGYGTYSSSGAVLARTTVLQSSNAGAKVNFSASPIVFITLLAEALEEMVSGKVLSAVVANTTISIPSGWSVSEIFFANTTANAVTGGVKIGTTSGATDVVVAQAIGANALGFIADASILKKIYSRSAAQTLFIQAVTAWNSASLELSFVLRKVF